MAQEILTRRQIKLDPNANIHTLGEQWVPRFLQRHPELQSVIGCTIEAARVKEVTKETIQQWYDEFFTPLLDENIAKENV